MSYLCITLLQLLNSANLIGVDRLRVIIDKELYVLETFYELLVVIVFADGSR